MARTGEDDGDPDRERDLAEEQEPVPDWKRQANRSCNPDGERAR
jgi:hypothetical protein